jgi:hypothetical protein
MNYSHSIMVAYGHHGLRSALSVAEALESIAEVQLRSYDELQRPLDREPDVALCLVIDDETLEKAHQVQVRLEDVPTFVIDGLGEVKIELNGYAGRLSSSPDQVLKAIRQHLVSHPPNHLQPLRQCELKRQPRRISSPFDYALARAAGDAQTPQAVLIAAARQLSWDLRADRVEVFLRMVDKNAFRCIYAEPQTYAEPKSHGRESAPSLEIIRLIKKRSYPLTIQELETRASLPLFNYLTHRNCNLLLPLVREARLLGWLAFGVEPSRCNDEMLDDLQVAVHLLTTNVVAAFERDSRNQQATTVFEALAALNFGILTLSQEGRILSVTGATVLLGSEPREGDHFKAIHNSHAREVIAYALQGSFLEKSWIDFDSQAAISCLATKLSDGKIAVFWGPREFKYQKSKPQCAPSGMDLKAVLDSLPVPVLVDNETSPGTAGLPRVQISDADGQAIRACASQAHAKNVKALRLRLEKGRTAENAVLFYESNNNEGSIQLADDIKHAVRFSLEAA